MDLVWRQKGLAEREYKSKGLAEREYKYPPHHRTTSLLSRSNWLLNEELKSHGLEPCKGGSVAQMGGFGVSILVKEVEGNKPGDLR